MVWMTYHIFLDVVLYVFISQNYFCTCLIVSLLIGISNPRKMHPKIEDHVTVQFLARVFHFEKRLLPKEPTGTLNML